METDNSKYEFAISLEKVQIHQDFLKYLLFIMGENPDSNYFHTFQKNIFR